MFGDGIAVPAAAAGVASADGFAATGAFAAAGGFAGGRSAVVGESRWTGVSGPLPAGGVSVAREDWSAARAAGIGNNITADSRIATIPVRPPGAAA